MASVADKKVSSKFYACSDCLSMCQFVQNIASRIGEQM